MNILLAIVRYKKTNGNTYKWN